MVKRLPTMWETWVWSLGWEDPLEKEMATHSSTLAWKILWKEEPGSLLSMGSQRVGQNTLIWTNLISRTHVPYLTRLLWELKQITSVKLPGKPLFPEQEVHQARERVSQRSPLKSKTASMSMIHENQAKFEFGWVINSTINNMCKALRHSQNKSSSQF